jgi:MFS family permease
MDSSSPRQGRVFYGWVIVAACLFISLIFFGIRYSFGVFFTPLEEEFGWPRATTSGVFSTYMILAAVFAIVGGWALDRYGPRPVVGVMGAITGVGLILTSSVDSLWQLYLTYGFLLALGTGAVYAIVMSTGTRWFVRRRATALAVIGTGAGLGTVIMTPISAQLISAFDWRTCFTVLAVVVWVTILPAAWFLKKEPADIGALPDGETEPEPQLAEGAAEPEHLSLAVAAKTGSFRLFFFIWFGYSFCLHLMLTHVVPRAQDVGIAPVEAAGIVGLVGAVTIPFRIGIGMAADRIGRKTTGVVCALIHTVAMLWLIGATDLWMFYLFAVIYGIGYGGIDPPIVALIGDVFGLRRVGVIMGSLIVGWGLGAALGPYLAGLIFDVSGSYTAAFVMAALAMVAVALFITRLRVPGTRRTRIKDGS